MLLTQSRNLDLKDTKAQGRDRKGVGWAGKKKYLSCLCVEPTAEKNKRQVISESVILLHYSLNKWSCYMQIPLNVSMAFGEFRNHFQGKRTEESWGIGRESKGGCHQG